MNTSVAIEAELAEKVSSDLHDEIHKQLQRTIVRNIFS